MADNGLVIETRALTKRYGDAIVAVDDLELRVRRGEVYGFLGPNGAGKTTTIKMLITLLIPTSGSATVLGYDVVSDAREVRKRIGYVFGGDRGLYERLSAYDNLRYFAELYAVPVPTLVVQGERDRFGMPPPGPSNSPSNCTDAVAWLPAASIRSTSRLPTAFCSANSGVSCSS